ILLIRENYEHHLTQGAMGDSTNAYENCGMSILSLTLQHIDSSIKFIFPQLVSLKSDIWTIQQLTRMLNDLEKKARELMFAVGHYTRTYG
ncbi:hypothetical protein, partial [Acinetobacter baumannii]|uniref:hypothetical protein n=1 Tax=Acinetobacter baumannii TaxID=470 RepID=UPI001C074AEA